MAEVFDLHYGDPGSAKSLSLIRLIEKLHTETGKIARVYVGDGSATMYRASGMVASGVVQLMEFSVRDEPFTTLAQICEGYIPVNGETNCKMRRLTPEEVLNTGMWVFEGLAVAGNYMMGDMKGGLANRAAAGEVIGQDTNVKITDHEGKRSFGGNSGAHYNLAQRQLLQNILRTKALPGHVHWTTHERYDDGERGGSFAKGTVGEKVKLTDKLIGPEVIGKAMTANISREFGNTLHYTIAGKRVQVGQDALTGKGNYVEKAEYRIYTRDHYDPDGITPFKYRAVTRTVTPELVQDFYTNPKAGMALLDVYTALGITSGN